MNNNKKNIIKMYHYTENHSMNTVKYNRYYRNAEYSGFVNGYNSAIYEKSFQLGYEYGKQNKDTFQIPEFYKNLHIPSENKKTQTYEDDEDDELSYSEFSQIIYSDEEDNTHPNTAKKWVNNDFYESLNSPIKRPPPPPSPINYPPLPRKIINYPCITKNSVTL